MPKGPQLNLNYFVDNAHILKNEKNVFNSQNSHFRSHFFGFNSLKTCVQYMFKAKSDATMSVLRVASLLLLSAL